MTKILMTPHIREQIEETHIGFRSRNVYTYDSTTRTRSHGPLLTEAYSVTTLAVTDEHCKTGCWKFDPVENRHIIKISPLAYDTIATPNLGAGVRKLVAQLFKAVYEHEAAHSRFTTKNLKGLNDTLKKEKIPWRLMNLFEDIRIERLWRRLLHCSFRWLRWEKYPADVSKVTPTALLYWMKTSMGYSRCIPRACRTHFHVHPNWSKVVSYFYRIECAPSTEELVPIALEWLKDFPHTTDESIEGAGGMGGDLGTGDLENAMAEAGEKVEKVKKGDRGPVSDSPVHGKAPGEGVKPAEVSLKGSGPGDATGMDSGHHVGALPRDNTEASEVVIASRLAGMLATAFKGVGVAKAATARPSKRLNIKAILRKCYDLPYIGKMLVRTGRPHISILFDGSSSMRGAHCSIDRENVVRTTSDRAGRILLRALSMLARKGMITGDAYLCAAGGVNFRAKLPFRSPLDFKRFLGFSNSEGFGQALRRIARGSKYSCFDEVSKHRLAICYTDGCITDAPIERLPLRERGVHTLGICCTQVDRTPQLKAHFDTPISRSSLWGLADALVRFLKTKAF